MAVRCATAGDYLTRTTNLPSPTSFTHMVWASLTVDMDAPGTALGFGSFGAFLLGVSDDGTTLSAYDSYNEALGSTWTLGTWKHLAIAVSGSGAGQALFYADGAVFATLDGHAEFTATALRLGAHPHPAADLLFNGRLAAHKLYDIALTATQIQQEMRQYVPVSTTSLNAWAPLLLHTDLKDYSGAARDYTGSGTLTTEDGPPIPWARQPQTRRRRQRRRLLPFMMQHAA
jgi:concanavalin A-like lectin/glucanase superfamily protein